MRFDGRFLHGAPSSRRVEPRLAPSGGPEEEDSTRYTFLCNVWLHHRPVCSRPCPPATIQKMSRLLEFSPSSRRLSRCQPQESAAASPPAALLVEDEQLPALLDVDAVDCALESFPTNDVGHADAYVLKMNMPSSQHCHTLVQAGTDNIAMLDRRTQADAVWLAPVAEANVPPAGKADAGEAATRDGKRPRK